MPSTLYIYFIKIYSRVFFLIFLILIIMLLLIGILDNLSKQNSELVTYSILMKIIITKIPYLIHETSPFLFTISSLMFFNKISYSQELITAISFGLNKFSVSLPIIFTNLILSLAMLFFMHPISSYLLNKSFKLEQEYFGNNTETASFSEAGISIKEHVNNSVRVILAKKISIEESCLTDLTIFNTDFNNEINRIKAEKATFNQEKIILEKVTIFNSNENITLHEYSLETKLNFEDFKSSITIPEGVSFWALPSFIKILNKAGISSNKHLFYYYKILIRPIIVVLLTIFSSSFASYSQTRDNKINLETAKGTIISFNLYFLSMIISSIISSYNSYLLLSNIMPVIFISGVIINQKKSSFN